MMATLIRCVLCALLAGGIAFDSANAADSAFTGNAEAVTVSETAAHSGRSADASSLTSRHGQRLGGSALAGTQVKVAMPTVGAAIGRRNGGHPITGGSVKSSHPTPTLRAVAGTTAIGGPHAPGGATIGGPANGRTATMLKASINATALHRRF
jgi:hypothetical protein